MENTQIDEEQLIDMVENIPLLWNVQDPNYHNRRMEKEAWDHISDAFGVNGNTIKKKWTILRSQYHRELARLNQPTGSAAASLSKWKHFHQLSFLSDVFTSRNMVGNMPSIEMTEEYLDLSDNEDVPPASVSGFANTSTPNSITANRQDKSKLSKQSDLSNIALQILRTEKEKLQHLNKQSSNYLFASSFAEPLDKLPQE
ncbi:uncharacterized protein LOC125769686 [Anopheles funestus]|uniref:uncharacterized protein LOC125769686 n=1 Tax=Anopheles funestus TaxID=62324 RepID=UPI0020C66E85|nr:uncharacterized protein LOC125769686 [Anopheles funestus]